MRIGILGLLHESNTFSTLPTRLKEFQDDLFLEGPEVLDKLTASHHEVGGFLAGLGDQARHSVEVVPLFVTRAIPSGPIASSDFEIIVNRLLDRVSDAGPLDGVLAAIHGAAVSTKLRDADGAWLRRLRIRIGPSIPLVGTLDAHANVSAEMVTACNALLAYRTNPHLDQFECGRLAADMIVRIVAGEIVPHMSAVAVPAVINIDRQCTDEEPLQGTMAWADEQWRRHSLLSNSMVFGFPYADVAELGAAVIAISDGDAELADRAVQELANYVWEQRSGFRGELLDVDQALDSCATFDGPVCLLDMGDNIGGGSAADGTFLLRGLVTRKVQRSFVCLYDPESVAACRAAGVGAELDLLVGGKSDSVHGDPVPLQVTVTSFHDGLFSESQPRHGGMVEFDQGPTVVAESSAGITVMLTSRRMVPFSLSQLTSCGLDPAQFRFLIAKGVNAPIAAYREVCRHFVRVNTSGATTADLSRLEFRHRRRPLFPFETDFDWNSAGKIVHGWNPPDSPI